VVWHTTLHARETAIQIVNQREFVEGLEYQLIDPSTAVENDSLGQDRVEVAMLFLYACPHCNALDEKLIAWARQKGGDVVLKRIPAIVGVPWSNQARAFFTAEQLNILETAHIALFKSIQEHGNQYADNRSVMNFFVKLGVKPDDFLQAYQSTDVDKKVSQAREMTVKYDIRSVPAIIVNGKYRTAQYYTGTQDRLIRVLDMLVDRELGTNTH